MFNVCGIYRDNSDYLTRHFIDQLNEAIDKFNNIHCYFYENDSDDNTLELLSSKLNTRPTILHERHDDRPKIGRCESKDRIENLSYYRNKLLSLRPYEPTNKWTMFVDSDIYFNDHSCVGSLTSLLEMFLSRTYPDNTVGVCCNGKHPSRCELHPGRECYEYYDTYPLVLTNDSWVHRDVSCMSPRTCNWWLLQRDQFVDWSHNKPVEVHSAFGGLSFYMTNVLNDMDVKYGYTIWKDGHHIMSEHVAFNHTLREHGKLMVDPALVVFNRES